MARDGGRLLVGGYQRRSHPRRTGEHGEKTFMTLWKNLVVALVAAFALAACSSSDNGTDTSMPTDPPPPTQAEQDLEALQDQIAALREQLGIDDTANIGTTVAELQATLKDLQDEAAALVTAANVMAAEALFAGIGETATDLTVAVSAVADEDGGGGMAAVTVTDLTPGVAGDDVVKSAEPMQGNWQGTMLTETIADDADTNPGTSSTVVVYTNIEAPEPVPFGEVHELTNDVLTIAATTDAAAHTALISASGFNHTGRMVHDPDEADTSETIRIRGMFNGAAGEYRCTEGGTAGSCQSIESAAGIRLAGTWIFDPDSMAMAMMVDPSFAYFGWWLNMGTDQGVETGVFHGVTDGTGEAELLGALEATSFNPLGGTATYTGAAAGQYALRPSLSSASGGNWTADATLTADFGNEAVGGMISGEIDNFMSGDTPMDWSVALGETTITATGTFDSATGNPATGDGVVWTIGDVDAAESGAWSGGLRATGADDSVPTLAVGMFTAAHGSVGHLLGAFGVELQ